MPHHACPDEEGDKYPSLRLEFLNRFFDREKAAANYQRYLTEYEFADQAGFAGLMINEHHSTPSCVNVGVNMTAAVLGRTTRRAKILLLGNILPIEDNPVRMAEQLAMADLISGGRVLSGFVRGVGVETWWANSNPVHNRQGAAEAGRSVTQDNLGFLICAVTAETKAKALEAGRHFVWRMGPTLRAPAEWFAPVGMRSRAGSQFALRARPRSLATMSYEELVEGRFMVAGTPDGVTARFARRAIGPGVCAPT